MARTQTRYARLSGTSSLAVYYLFFIALIAALFTVTAFAQPLQASGSNPVLFGPHSPHVDRSQFPYWGDLLGGQRQSSESPNSFTYDVVIYGSSPAAITAAVQVQSMGHSVAIVCPEKHIGGLTASGLGWTDSKNGNAIGGIARDFYHDVYTHYLNTSAWTTETRQNYLDKHISAQPGMAIDPSKEVQWTFEPHVAEAIFERWLRVRGITVHRGEFVVRDSTGVSQTDGKINSFTTESGKTFKAQQFIDAGYEGDLMASAGISYLIGRDSDEVHSESLAGMRLNTGNSIGTGRGRAYEGVDPYKVKGDSSSGLLKGIEVSYDELPKNFTGAADNFRLQSYMFRLCLTREKENRVEFTRPDGYKESDYELLIRYYEAGHKDGFTTQLMPNGKTDSNSQGEVSFDFLGGNYDLHSDPPISYSAADYERRKEFVQAHIDWQKGLLWTLSHHKRIPAERRRAFLEWGLTKDEFVANNNWPYQLYIREARRMQGAFVFTQQDVQNKEGYFGDAVAGLGSYSIDSHPIRRVVLDGKIYDEGYFYVKNPKPYPIPLKTLFPRKSEATNFINPVTVSASHVAFGSVRMEPTYMILGQSAGIAAVMGIESKCAVQDIDQKAFMKNMDKYKQRYTV